jgi:hypothetical protein|tara:strand:+ start:2986 stop:4479 length:1494 start_codon:yes stop_codon:yes gene_type:complete
MAVAAEPGVGPYGSTAGRLPDRNGLVLPEGFSSRVVAVSGDPVGASGYEWPLFPGGAGTFADGTGGWFYACNSAVYDYLTPWKPMGGASAVHFDPYGEVLDAYRILAGSHSNRDGGPTPWGTWMSCEQDFEGEGIVWECDPSGSEPAVARAALGRRRHGSATVNPVDGVVYLTEAERDGLLYKFTPDEFGDLSAGRLEAMILDADGTVGWGPVADPSGGEAPSRQQVPGAFVTAVGGGVWCQDGWLWLTTSLDNRVHAVDLVNRRYELVWDGVGNRQPLAGIADLTVAPVSGDLYVAEDRGDMELVLIGVEGDVAPFARFADPTHRLSEVSGPCFDPAGERLYFSSLRGPGNRLTRDVIPDVDWGDAPEGLMVGVTYEVTGPFRGIPADTDAATAQVPGPTMGPALPATTVRSEVAPTTAVGTATDEKPATEAPPSTVPVPLSTLAGVVQDNSRDDSPGLRAGTGVAVAVGIAAVGGVLALRRRRGAPDGESDAEDP